MYLNILYKPTEHDSIFSLLKKAFGAAGDSVEVENIVPQSFVTIKWEGLLDSNELAQQLTEAVPQAIIECESQTGIDVYSRYFNSNQLW